MTEDARKEFERLGEILVECRDKKRELGESERLLHSSDLTKLLSSSEAEELHPFAFEVAVGIRDWYKAKHPRRRKITIARALEEHGDEFREFVDTLCEQPKQFVEDLSDKIKAAKKRREELAPEIDIRKSDTFVTVWTVHISMYRSQGYGQYKYTQVAALLEAERAERAGLETRVIEDKENRCYHAQVACPEDDVEIVQLLPPLSLEDFVLFCDENCANPKVIRSFIKWEWVDRIRAGEWPIEGLENL